MALIAALSAVVARATASDAPHEVPQQPPNDPRAWGFHLIPVLILSATVLLSLEIFNHTRVSRPLAATALAALWTTVLHQELQAASLLAALVVHGVREAHGVWTRALPSLVRRDAASRFALRVFVWTAALATAAQLHGTPHGVLEALRATFFVVLYSECAELLLTRYFSDKAQLTGYNWRRRVVPFAAVLLVGALYASHALTTMALWILRRVRPVTLALALVVVMGVVVRVDWSSAAASAERQARALVALVRNKIRPPTPKPRTGQRRSFLYRVGSDVEVVSAAMHYEAYDFRHKHHVEDV